MFGLLCIRLTILPFLCSCPVLVSMFAVGHCVLWVLCGLSKATARCYTSICDGIISVAHCQKQWASLGVKFWGKKKSGNISWKVALGESFRICYLAGDISSSDVWNLISCFFEISFLKSNLMFFGTLFLKSDFILSEIWCHCQKQWASLEWKFQEKSEDRKWKVAPR